ncbi:hypothetical protein NIES4071_108120 (plasmid) [Calothrix sp. NIES-4071]|nr:hypothetical protein NIES4071_108120 [Calothrix sp. NIES-4071]BAZ64852.1 hypothetical protein NIES4105_105850 [Calothrix sp. NIES-4105]
MYDEDKAFLDEMVRIGKIKIEYKDTLLEIYKLIDQAKSLGIFIAHGWGEDANHNVIDEYEIIDNEGNSLYLTLADTCLYLQSLIAKHDKTL